MATFLIGAFLTLLEGVLASHNLCGQYDILSSGSYVFNNDAWNEDDSGSVCTYVSQDPASNFNSWYALWLWSSNPPIVRAFPHVELHSSVLPVQLQYLESLRVSASWSLQSGAPAGAAKESKAGTLPSDIQANVVIDVFADDSAERSQMPAKQKYEIMIWVARFGDASQPIGMNDPTNPPIVAAIDGTEFTLYTGVNSNGQQVSSWVADKPLTSFDSDFAPLLGSLVAQNLVPKDIYIGAVQFGTETFFASQEMNFSVSAFEAEVRNISGGATSTASMPTATLIPQPTHTVGSGVRCSNALQFLWTSVVLSIIFVGR